MMRRLLPSAALLLLLGACAVPNDRFPEQVNDPSKPNVASVYYYLTASLMHYNGDFVSAAELYRRALAQDGNSPQIKKQILINSAYAYINGQQTKEQTLAEFAQARADQHFDQDVLNAAYSVYNEAEDKENLDWVINRSISSYPSCRAYLQKFFLDYSNKKTTDTKLLDKAYKLANKNVEELILTARMYALVNHKRAISILKEAKSIDAKPEISLLLNEMYLRAETKAEATAYFLAYNYPADKASMLHFLQTANKTLSFAAVISVQDTVLATSDASLLGELAFAAYMQEDVEVLNRVHNALTNKVPEPEEDARVAVFLLGQSLFSDAMAAPQVFGDMLFGTQDVEDMLLYRTLRYTMKLNSSDAVSEANIYDELVNACRKLLPDSPLARYIIVTQEELLVPRDSVRTAQIELSRYYIHLHRGYAADWTNLITDYQLKGLHNEKISLLRKAIERFHNNPLFLNDLGYSLLDYPGSWDEAGELISAAIAMEPDNAYYQDSMAWFYYLKRDLSKALEHIRIPMQIKELPGEINYHIGVILRDNNDLQTAEEYFRKATLDADFPLYQEKAKAALTDLGLEP